MIESLAARTENRVCNSKCKSPAEDCKLRRPFERASKAEDRIATTSDCHPSIHPREDQKAPRKQSQMRKRASENDLLIEQRVLN